VELLVGKRAGVVLLIEALRPDHGAVSGDSGALPRLVKGAALGTEIVHVKVIALPALITPDLAHGKSLLLWSS
jgi:hypothetical protein